LKRLPPSNNSIVLRTDFSDQSAWDAIRAEIEKPVDGFYAYVMYVDDPEYDGLTKPQILELFEDENYSFVIVADRRAMSDPEHPLLVIDLFDEHLQEFRTIPSGVQAIENNLSIANMDFEEFANAAGADGVYRGFPRS
jgi:hypothetical protein